MSYPTHYTKRPPSNCKAARIAWDELTRRAVEGKTPNNAPSTIAMLRYARDLSPYPWTAELADGEYIDMDELEVRDRKNNPHKYTELMESGQTGTDGSQKPNDAAAIPCAKAGRNE